MSDDPAVIEPIKADPPQESKPATLRSIIAIVIVCAILLLPALYLFLHHSSSVAAGMTQPVAAPAQDIAALETAARVSPTIDNRINLSRGYINANTPGRAIPVLLTVVAADPNNLLAWNNLCVAHTLVQDYKTALDDCHRAVQIDPTFQLAKNNLKWAGDEDQKAIDALAKLEQTPPADRDSKFYLAEGLSFLHTGDNDQAIKAWQRALDLDPTNTDAANNIGVAYMAMKQPASALKWFQKAAALDPSLQLAKNNIAWAQGELAKSPK
jgi:tetratricopeptide (TPR) repeat protein